MTEAFNLPAVTDAHRRAAFASLCLKDCNYEQAMANDLRSRLIECRAHVLRTREWHATQLRGVSGVKRVVLDGQGNQAGWCTQIVMGAHEPRCQDDLLEGAL